MASVEISEQKRFVVLDGMRGLAALAVITDHVNSPALTGFLASRWLAVDFFFVLSGFVLSHVYGQRLASGMSTWSFMRARVIRLYPLYLVGTLMSAALAAALILKHWSHVAWGSLAASTGLSLLFLPTPLALWPEAGNIYPLDGPAWSLFFELFVNVVFALFFLRLGPRALAIVLAAAGAILIASGMHYGMLASGYNWENFPGGFPRVMFGFFAGVVVHRWHLKHPAPALPAWAALLLLLVILAMPAQGVWRLVFDLVAAMVLFPLLVAVSANSRASGVIGKGAAAIGMLSYGIYILHVPIRDWLNILLVAVAPDLELPGAAMVGLVAVCAIVAAGVLHVIYDEPVRRWLMGRRKPRPA